MAALHLSVPRGRPRTPATRCSSPAQTHVATAHAVELCGARPVFVDADPRTGNIDLADLEAQDHARAPERGRLVHYLGLPVDMPPRA